MTLRIKNWEKFQHYKDRKPPWIKLYRDLLDNFDYHALPDCAGKALPLIWILGSESDGVLPDQKEISFRLRIDIDTAQLVLYELENHGFIEDVDDEQLATQKPASDSWGSRYIPKNLRDEIMDRDKKCVWCGKKKNLEIDHIVPVSRGGESIEENLQVLCRSCNRKKRTQSPSEQVATQTNIASKKLRSPETETESETETYQSRDKNTRLRAKKTKRCQLPDDWYPNAGHLELATSLGLKLLDQAERFRDYWKGNGNTKADWDATFRNWLRNADRYPTTRAQTKTQQVVQNSLLALRGDE